MATKKYLDDNGLLYLWGKLKAAFLTAVSYDSNNHKITVTKNGTTTDVVTAADIVADGGAITSHQDISGKADKVVAGTVGHLASLGTGGNLADSGYSASDFVSSADLSGKADKATTLAGYGITDAYTKTEVDAKVTAVYKPAGSAATVGDLGALTAANEGKVYNMTAAFTATSSFVEGAGNQYPAGTNVAIINTASSGTAAYKYDVLQGIVDLSTYVQFSDLVAITNAEIDVILS